MSHCLATAPLKIAKTFAQEEGIEVCVMDCSPGLLAGDSYLFDWHLEADTRVKITTQGFTRVHPSRDHPCQVRQHFRLERGAVLEWFPQPLVLYREAALRSECEIELDAGAALLMGEIVCAGRTGRGEAFEFQLWTNHVRVRREGRLIFVSQTGLRPQAFDPKRVGGWGDCTHQGQFLAFVPQTGAALLTALRNVTEKFAVWSGASQLEQGGVMVSLLGRRACDLQEVMLQLQAEAQRFLATENDLASASGVSPARRAI